MGTTRVYRWVASGLDQTHILACGDGPQSLIPVGFLPALLLCRSTSTQHREDSFNDDKKKKNGNMDGASAIAGLVGLIGPVLQAIHQIRTICEEYSTVKEKIDRVPDTLQEASQWTELNSVVMFSVPLRGVKTVKAKAIHE